MIKKIMKILFITSLLFLMIGAACASEVSNDTQTDVYSNLEADLVQDTPSSAMEIETVQEEKSILKEEKNTKTSSKTYDVRDFDTLKNSLTNSTYDNVTLNINSNIKLTDNTTLHGAIKTLTINGNGKTVDGNQNRFLNIQYNTNVTIINLTIKNCYAYNGGAIYCSYANLTIVNSSFNHNNASFGGAVYCYRSNVTIDGSILNYNKGSFGGAVYNYYYTNLTINDSLLNNNYASSSAGAIYNNNGYIEIYNTSLNNNSAYGKSWEYCGGAIRNYGNISIEKCILNNNWAYYDGGAIYNWYNNTIIISNSTLNNNLANNTGGVIRNCGNISIINSNINNNTATGLYGGGAILNGHVAGNSYLNIKNTTLNNNWAYYDGGVISNWNSGIVVINNSTLSNNRANASGGTIENGGNLSITNSYLYNNTAKKNGSAIYNYANALIENNIFKTNKANMTGNVIIDDKKTATIKNNTNDTISQYSGTIYTKGLNVSITGNKFDDGILYTNTSVYTTKGVIGNKLTLTAKITDITKKNVTNGYVIFKLNGITIKDNKKLTGSTGNLKVYVKDGVATVNLTADLEMRHAKNLTAVYAGSTTYNASRSNTATAEIALRHATITVTTSTKITKQGQNITLKATVKDTLRKNTNLEEYDGQYVFFKINGITLKDTNGKTVQAKIVNGTASLNYTVPLALSGVTDCKTMTPKNHTVTAGFVNPNYYPTARTNTTFQVERSNITINFENVTINNKTHKIAVKANIKDYLGNYVKGPNKYVIKINGATLKNASNTLYFQANNGIINIKDITIPVQQKYTSIEIVTQDRLGYKNQRNMTTKINLLK